MTGRTNYTEIANGSAMQGPAQITSVLEHFDPLIGETVTVPELLPLTGNWPGRTIYVQSTLCSYIWSGADWLRLAGKAGGTCFAEAGGATGNIAGAYATVVFPAGRFTQIPWVTATSNGAQIATPNIGSISKDQMTIAGFVSGAAVSCNFYWHAVQMTPESASG